MPKNVLGGRQIRVKEEDAEDGGAGGGEVSGGARDADQVHADGASGGGASEGVLPELFGGGKMPVARFDDGEVGSGIDEIGVEGEGLVVKVSGASGVALLEREIGQTGQDGGVVGKL